MSAARPTAARRLRNRLTAIAAVILIAAGLFYTTQNASAEESVQFYTVSSSSENLGGIAQNLLGDSSRSTEIFNLNTGRRQWDGGSLSDGNQLHAGWYLVVPWDAVGPGVASGPLPKTSPVPDPGTGSTGGGSGTTGGGSDSGGGQNAGGQNTGGQSGATGQNDAANGKPGASTGQGQAVKPGDPNGPAAIAAARTGPGALPTSPPPLPTGKCVAATAASRPSNWGMSRLAPDRAWELSRGTGQLVAIVDSGVDGRAAALSGRVAIGANIVTGDGRGDTDCLGTGTAMAGLVAAEPSGKQTFAGVAPESVVMPVRVVMDGKDIEKADQAAAIEVAASAGATVIALGSYVDILQDAVAAAVRTALDHNVVVVAGAPVAGKSAGAVQPPEGVILVGGVSQKNKMAAEYAPNTVDLVAPGVNVTSIGANGSKAFVGSGTQYAVALTAGAAALVRSAHPELTAQQVAHRLAVTSQQMDGDAAFGHGMVDLVAAVTKELPEEVRPGKTKSDRPKTGVDNVRIAFLITVLAGLILSALLVFRFRRTMRRAPAEGDDGGLDDAWPADVKAPRTPEHSGAGPG